MLSSAPSPRQGARLTYGIAPALFGVLLGLAIFLTAGPAAAYHPNHALGFAADRTYQGAGQLDQVDLFTGTLSLSVPVGPFTMSYTSNVWRYQPVIENGQPRIQARPDRSRFGGLGWHFSWGVVYSPVHALNDTGRWMYVDRSGGQHVFYDQLHAGEDDGDASVLYSRDGSFLRLRKHNAFFVDIEFPDGTTRRFNSWTGGLGARYWIEKVWGPHASAQDPDAWATYDPSFTEWTWHQRHGAIHRVFTDNSRPWLWTVNRVEVGTVGGASVDYDFHYAETPIDVSCKDTAASTSQRISVPLLTAIDLPDGSRFEMPSHHTTCAGGIADVSGALRELRLPTGGRYQWTYREREFPPGASNSVFNTNSAVDTRTTLRKDGSPEGTWTYKWTSFGPGPSGLPHDDPKAMVDVVYPTGDCTRHYFNTIYWQIPSTGRGWEYGLPFDYSQSVAGRNLSSEVWDGSAGGSCAGDKLRSTYLAFRHDVLPDDGNAPPSEWYHTHRQVTGTRVVFHDDGDRFVDTQNSDYDGLGHFRRTVTTGSLWNGSTTQERRDVFTAYDRAQGTYGSPGYQIPSPSDPWILGTFSHVETHEPDALGQTSKRVDMRYDATTGDLMCTRIRKSTAALRHHDIVTTYTRDGRGRVTDLKTYGGDLQTLQITGDGCAGLPSLPEYWIRHGYEHGVRTSTRPILPDGTPGPFLILDRDVDPTSGATLTERDPSGFAVTFHYDGQGRSERVVPDEGAVTTIQYLPATTSTPQKVITRLRNPISDSVLSTQEAWFDDFGRAWRQRSSMPGGAWNERETLYNARGWATSVSEPADLSKRTEFRDFDPFGRATRIRPPSGPAHDTLITHEGVRRVTTKVKVARPWGEAYVSRVREADSHGRLRRTEEPSGPQDAMTPTTYAYDVASRLTRVRSGSGTVQERLYVYDNRGFLLSETHPEKGATGNGTVTYGARDSQGRVLRVTDGPSDLNYGYDFLGRRTRVWDRNAGGRVVVAIEYDGAPGRGVGKIWKATRNQWVDVPWTAGSSEELAKVVETFSYQGLAGAASSKTTRTTVGGENVAFTQTYDWNDLGLPSRVHYAGQGTDYTYDQGLLDGVTGWGTFEYHPSGMWHRVHH
ncbi:MAG: hypothetical protein AAGN66_26650, partial [Acidobacteriota bacterium]